MLVESGQEELFKNLGDYWADGYASIVCEGVTSRCGLIFGNGEGSRYAKII